MDCQAAREWLPEAVCSCEPSNPALVAEAKAHAMACQDCRSEYEELLRLRRAIQAGQALERQVDTAQVQARVMAIVRRETQARIAAFSLTRSGRRWWLVGSAAAAVLCVIAGLAVWHSRPAVKSSLNWKALAIRRIPPAAPTARTDSPASKGRDAADLAKTLAALGSQLKGAKGSATILREVAGQLEALLGRWPSWAEVPAAYKLLADCYEQMGEASVARQTFWAYIEAADERAKATSLAQGADPVTAQRRGDSEAVALAERRAKEAFGRKDYAEALTWYNDLVACALDPQVQARAKLGIGLVYEEQRLPEQAIEQVQAALACAGEGRSSGSIYLTLARLYLNSNRLDKANAIWDALAARFPSEDIKACALFNKGWNCAANGLANFPAALGFYAEVVKQYPHENYAALAKHEIQKMKLKVMQ